jgi:hypothetical protein
MSATLLQEAGVTLSALRATFSATHQPVLCPIRLLRRLWQIYLALQQRHLSFEQ